MSDAAERPKQESDGVTQRQRAKQVSDGVTQRQRAKQPPEGVAQQRRDRDEQQSDGVTQRRRVYTAKSLLGDTFASNELIGDRYRLLYEIGRGGMGVVVAAHDTQVDRRVAIKVLLPELASGDEVLARFDREARVLAMIDSDHVCRLYDSGTLDDGAPYMVLEMLRGRDLGMVLADEGRLSLDNALNIIIQACKGVQAAHDAGVTHRDLKPENIFLYKKEGGGHCVKVLDFGLSKLMESVVDGRRTRKLTADTQVMGTPCYMAPEQWLSGTRAGPAADQWALATILFEMVTGVSPFLDRTIGQICGNIVNRATPSLLQHRPNLPLQLDLKVRKALEKRAANRYASVTELAAALAPFRGLDLVPEQDDARPDLPRRLRSKIQVLPSDMDTTMRKLKSEQGGDDSGAHEAEAVGVSMLQLSYASLGLHKSNKRKRAALVLAGGIGLLAAVALSSSGSDSATLASAGTLSSMAGKMHSAAAQLHDDHKQDRDTTAEAAASAASASSPAGTPSSNGLRGQRPGHRRWPTPLKDMDLGSRE